MYELCTTREKSLERTKGENRGTLAVEIAPFLILSILLGQLLYQLSATEYQSVELLERKYYRYETI